MTEKELEYLLLENLKYNKENNHYLIKIDRRQRWERTWKTLYWAALLALAATGYFYAFPYLKDIRDQFNTASTQFSGVVELVTPSVKDQAP